MAQEILSFNKGMITDITYPMRDGQSYLKAENFTFTPIGAGDNGSLTNSLGNAPVLQPVFPAGQYLVGYTDIIEDHVFFTTDGATSMIFHLEDNTLHTVFDDSTTPDGSKLNFSLLKEYRIIAVGRYEDEDNKKVYWTDDLNPVRYANVKRDYTGENADIFDITPISNLSEPVIVEENQGGSLKAGRIQYCYRLIVDKGAVSVFSYCCPLYSLIEKTGSGYTEYIGEDLDEIVNKSLTISISNLDTSFDKIEVYSVFYDDVTQSPTISLVSESYYTDTDIIIVDNGIPQGELTLEEFTARGGRIFKAKALEAKNNILFVGNIEEAPFDPDIDTRAYGYRNNNTTGILGYYLQQSYYATTGTLIRIYPNGDWEELEWPALTPTGPSGTNWDIPEDTTLHNPINDVYKEILELTDIPVPGDQYAFQADGTTPGGTGPVISYRIPKVGDPDFRTKLVMQDHEEYIEPDPKTKWYLSMPGHKTGEVYRYGIVFTDRRGRQSFAKWIADIRIPDVITQSTTRVNDTVFARMENNDAIDYMLDIEFTVDLSVVDPATVETIGGFKIVRAERRQGDKQILTQGFLLPTHHLGNNEFQTLSNPSTSAPVDNKILALHSPDILMGDLKNIEKDMKLRIKGYTECGIYLPDGNTKTQIYHPGNTVVFPGDNTTLNGYLYNESLLVDASPVTVMEKTEEGITLEGTDTDDTTPITVTFKNVPTVTSDLTNEQYGPTSYAISLKDSDILAHDTTGPANKLYIVDIIQNNINSAYGGFTHDAKQRTEYIQSEAPYVVVDGVPGSYSTTTGGDTYTHLYHQMMAYWNPVSGETGPLRQTAMLIPLESDINSSIPMQKPTKYLKSVPYVNVDGVAIQETTAKGIDLFPEKYPKDVKDLTAYNSAYSAESFYPKYPAKPVNFDPIIDASTLVIASEKKISNETIDNWTRFLYNNFIEVDAKYGELNDLHTVDNNLFFWQDKGFGTLAVNDRSTITDSEGSFLSLGTGTILERYDYISQLVGNRDKYNIDHADNTVFWLYSDNSKIYAFDSGLKELSTSAGVNQFILDKGFGIVDPITVCDTISNETLFKVNDEVLVYDQASGTFTGTYTYNPDWFIKFFNGNYMSIPAGENSVWGHNTDIDGRASYYGVLYDSTLKHISAEGALVTKVFDNIEWNSTSVAGEVNIYDNTFYTYRFYDEYQNTDWQPLEHKRKERGFTAIVPRDRVNASQADNPDIFLDLDANQKYKRRMRDKYCIIDLKYDNTDSRKFTIHDIIMKFRQSAR